MSDNIKTKVRNYLEGNFFSGRERELMDETPLLSSGIIDSISALQLVEYLESEFKFEFAAHEVDQENLDSLDTIVSFVQNKIPV